MKLSNHIPISLYKELDAAAAECRDFYPFWNPNNPVDMMFAMQIVLAREIVRLRNDHELDEMYPSDDKETFSVLDDMLSLVGVNVSSEIIATWSPQQRHVAEKWASLSYLAASDNDVEVPKQPDFLSKYNIPF